MGKRRKYSGQLKREAVGLIFYSDKTIKTIAEELGISHHNLAQWRKEYKKIIYFLPDNEKQRLSSKQSICQL